MFLEWFQWSVFEWVLVAALGLFLFIQCFYYLVYYHGVTRFSKRVKSGKIGVSEKQPPVTIIITTRDQESILAQQLPLILEQDYPEFQVVVVNDASADGTDDLLKRLAIQYPNLYHTFLPAGVQSNSTKKIALTVGIKAAKYDYLLFTEPNCMPLSKLWIAAMMQQFTAGTSIVLSYSRYEKIHGLLKKLIAFDNLFLGMSYLGMAASKKPYMGLGRNMAYSKELFFSQRGFASHLNLNFGEDDLFISDVAKKSNTRIAVSSDAVMGIVCQDAESHWKENRVNQMYTSSYYKPMARFRTGLELVSRYAFYTLFIAILVFGLVCWNIPFVIVGGSFFLLRYIIQLIVINRAAKTLSDKHFFISIPLLDLVLPCYLVFLRLSKKIHRRKSFSGQIMH